jgi:hypothetical protein
MVVVFPKADVAEADVDVDIAFRIRVLVLSLSIFSVAPEGTFLERRFLSDMVLVACEMQPFNTRNGIV